jgi:hypothetical protein
LNITGRLGQSRNSRDKRDADGKPEFLSQRKKERNQHILGFTMLFLGVNNHKEVPSININETCTTEEYKSAFFLQKTRV